MAFWSTKAAIFLKRVKIEETLLWGASHQRSALSNGTIPDPLRPPLPRESFWLGNYGSLLLLKGGPSASAMDVI